MAISFTFNNFTVIDVTPQDPHVEVTMSFSIPIDPTTQRRYLLYKDDDRVQTETTTMIHRQAQSCQTLSDSELQVWEQTITELLTVEIDPTTTALVSITITCITDDLIAFTAIFKEVCTTCGQTNTTQLAEDLTNDIETSIQTSVNNGTFIETLQDNANETITNCQVNCEALEAELETINNITDFGEPTVDMETFIFVSSVRSPAFSFSKYVCLNSSNPHHLFRLTGGHCNTYPCSSIQYPQRHMLTHPLSLVNAPSLCHMIVILMFLILMIC